MSWLLFIDESGQDRRESPYEVLAGIAVEDHRLWPLIRDLNRVQEHNFGIRLFRAYGAEAKAQKLLKKKTFRHATGGPAIPVAERRLLAKAALEDGENVWGNQLIALGQAKIAYCGHALKTCERFGCVAFASIIPNDVERPERGHLRKDYSYLFERFYHMLNAKQEQSIGIVVFDETEKTTSQFLVNQMEDYFIKTAKGRLRSRLIVPEPLFVHSDLTTMVQMADLIAYVLCWGVRLRNMNAPAREELWSLGGDVLNLRYHASTPRRYDTWGFTVIRDLFGGEERP